MPRRYAVRKSQIVRTRSPHRRHKRWRPAARWEQRVTTLMQDGRQPELRLWAAVMWEASRDLLGDQTRPDFWRASHWLTAPPETPEPLGAFNWLCVELDLDPAWVRRDLLTRIEAARDAA